MQTITLNSFIHNGTEHKSSSPISFIVEENQINENNESKTFYSIENEDFNINAFGDTIDELSNDLLAEMSFNWEKYAMTNPEHLSDKAKIVRENYLKNFS